MNLNTFPTKGNLILAKNSLALASQGYELMDKKRNILLRELMGLIDQAKDIQAEIDTTFTEAYKALQKANIELGIGFIQDIAGTIPVDDTIKIKTRSIMGVEIPLVEADTSGQAPTYAYYSTKESLDQARQAFEKTIGREAGSDCDIKIRGILSCLDSLERAVDKMIANSAEGGKYDENVSIWENDIQGLCSMIQEYITQYIYYETINMEHLQNELKLKMADRMQGYLALLAMVLIVGSCCSAAITRSITDPLRELRQTAEQLGSGNLDARARTGGLEEISVLAQAFNQMSDRIRRLLDKTRQEQKNLRELELRLLQEQISPHFLYNTLDSIVWMAEGGNNRQVVEMTTDLSDFFRTVLSGGREFVTIEEEESHIRSYLKIQKIRYEDILDYSIEIEPSIRRRIVLKMLLQPLVENALYHGIKNKRGGGCILIRGYEDRNGLVFEIEDNGKGIAAKDLPNIFDRFYRTDSSRNSSQGGSGIGLSIVKKIIEDHGGRIWATSKEGIGTEIHFVLRKYQEVIAE